jgi:hypothetical protein
MRRLWAAVLIAATGAALLALSPGAAQAYTSEKQSPCINVTSTVRAYVETYQLVAGHGGGHNSAAFDNYTHVQVFRCGANDAKTRTRVNAPLVQVYTEYRLTTTHTGCSWEATLSLPPAASVKFSCSSTTTTRVKTVPNGVDDRPCRNLSSCTRDTVGASVWSNDSINSLVVTTYGVIRTPYGTETAAAGGVQYLCVFNSCKWL